MSLAWYSNLNKTIDLPDTGMKNSMQLAECGGQARQGGKQRFILLMNLAGICGREVCGKPHKILI